jgi:hypothetical protein
VQLYEGILIISTSLLAHRKSTKPRIPVCGLKMTEYSIHLASETAGFRLETLGTVLGNNKPASGDIGWQNDRRAPGTMKPEHQI